MIMYRKNHESETSCILIECDHEVTKEVISLFKKYKIRKKVRKLKEVIRKFVKILKFFNFGLLYFFFLRMYPLDCDFCYINDEHFLSHKIGLFFFSQVDITEVSDEYKIFAALPSEEIGKRLWLPLKQREVTLAHPDPRLEQFGWRVVARDGSEVLPGAKQMNKF